MKHAGGRPKGSTKYDPTLVEKLDAYVDDCYKNHRIPWVERFCLQNDIRQRTFYHWAKNNEDLGEARQELMEVQKLQLMKLALSGKGNVRMIIYLLKRNHGMKEAKPSKTTIRENEAIFL